MGVEAVPFLHFDVVAYFDQVVWRGIGYQVTANLSAVALKQSSILFLVLAQLTLFCS